MGEQLDIFVDGLPADLGAAVEPVEQDEGGPVEWERDDSFYMPVFGRVVVPCLGGPAPEQVVKKLKSVVDDIYDLTYDRQCFERCCTIWLAGLRRYEDGEAPYMEAIDPWPDKAVRKAAEGFAILQKYFVFDGGFDDVLGRVYMRIRDDWGGQVLGQYFTPWPIAKMMARSTIGELGDEELRRLEEGPPIGIQDCACGSGVMLLAARAVIAEKYGRRALRMLRCAGQDIDPLCCTMCKIQLRLTNVPWALSLLVNTHLEMARKARGGR